MLSKTGIVIIGLIQSEPLSAYDMLKKIDAMNMRYWFPIGNTTLYEAVLRLDKASLIEGEGTDSKTIYKPTKKGLLALQETVRSLFLRIDYDTVWFCLAMMYSSILPKEELEQLIQRRNLLIEEYLVGINEKIAELEALHIPYTGLCAIDRMKEILLLEQESLNKLARK